MNQRMSGWPKEGGMKVGCSLHLGPRDSVLTRRLPTPHAYARTVHVRLTSLPHASLISSQEFLPPIVAAHGSKLFAVCMTLVNYLTTIIYKIQIQTQNKR
jgi:hypothetical protein